ncbi:MAG: 3'(2'),5'-bisphosphate nucleotidase CysQ [Saprospiraceae bacterium]|nr:3'(2'),5'-bisphosphate nucleotidase CysQ [Saprospiraceae bacterium]
MVDVQQYLKASRRAARMACTEILEVYDTFNTEDVMTKSDDSPLTHADLRANEIIQKTLQEVFPNIPFLSEENKQVPYAQRKDFPLCWMVDPLDGTKEFVKKNGEFTVNIALLSGGRPVLGVVAVPVSGALYWAGIGMGAWTETEGQATRLTARTFSRKDSGLRLVASRSHRDAETEAFMSRFHQPEIRPSGSSLKIILLAAGDADIYPRFAPTMEWDTAAADIILEEAGGIMVNAETGKQMQYNKPDLLNPHFLAYGNCTDCVELRS